MEIIDGWQGEKLIKFRIQKNKIICLAKADLMSRLCLLRWWCEIDSQQFPAQVSVSEVANSLHGNTSCNH